MYGKMNFLRIPVKKTLRIWKSGFNGQISRCFANVVSDEKIVRSPAPLLELPKGNVVDVILRDVNRWGNRIALECAETGKRVTHAELVEQSERWSGFLMEVGLSKGDVVAIISPNCVQYGPIFLGCAGVGVALSPINWKSTHYEIQRMLKMNGTNFIIFTPETEEKVLQALQGKTDEVLLLSIGKSRHERAINVNDILDGSQSVKSSSPDKLTGDEVLYMPFSSGTTGPPKAVALTHNAWAANILQFTNPYHGLLPGDSPDVTLGMLPFFHIYGLITIFSVGVFKGRKIVVLPKFDPQAFIGSIIKHKVDFLHCVPSLMNLLNSSPECNQETMGHIHTVVCGAAPFAVPASKRFKEKLKKDLFIAEAYGMSEVLNTLLVPRCHPRVGTCGQLLSNIEAKVIDPDTGEGLGPNQNGEICFRTPSAMKEYVNNTEGTRAILKDGWIHSGDIGFYDSGGFFSIVDRTKDLIKVQGLPVSPSEIEAELLKHRAVAECSVIGIPDERVGDAPKAFIVLKEKAGPEDLHRFLEQRLSKHKQLKGGITFVDALPKSETGKVLRRVLRTLD